jgi:hypothetical protein
MDIPILSNCKAEIFMVVDSCYSGKMIEDLIRSKFSVEKISLLTSTSKDESAQTGWKLIQILIENIFKDDFSSVKIIGEFAQANLVTPLKTQKANFYSNF